MFGINYLVRTICKRTHRHKHVLAKFSSCTCTSAVKMQRVGTCKKKYDICKSFKGFTNLTHIVKLQIVMLAGVTCVRVELRWRVCVEGICVCVYINDNRSR